MYGKLYPVLCEAVLPGDIWKGTSNILGRVTPLVQPIFGRFDIRTDFFFVPNRIIWDNWRAFISPDDNELTQQPVFPSFKVKTPVAVSVTNAVLYDKVKPCTLADYMGMGLQNVSIFPEQVSRDNFSMLPYRAYATIWNEFYRDQDLQDEVIVRKGDGFIIEEDEHLLDFLHANWEKDYFTTARPWAQKGQPAGIPISFDKFIDSTTGQPAPDGSVIMQNGQMLTDQTPPGHDVTLSSGFTIEDLRYANSLQRWLERNSRRGTRYIESLMSHFGVRVPDYRLQRPEFIGGGRQPLVISEVLQTNNNPTDETPPVS